MTFVRFRLVILGGFLALAAMALMLILAVANRAQTRQAQAGVNLQLEVARSVFIHLGKRQEAELDSAVRLLGADFGFKSAFATKDPATIQSNALSLRERIGADALWIMDGDGKLYAETTRRETSGGSLASLAPVAAAIAGRSGAMLAVYQGVPYQLAAAPITASDMGIIIMAGFKVGDETAVQLKRLTGADVSFSAKGSLFASTLSPPLRAGLEHGLARPAMGRVSRLDHAGRRSLVLPIQSSDEVTVFLQRSWDEALEPAAAMRRLLVLISLAALAATATAGWLIAGAITSSIRKLVEEKSRLNEELAQLNRFQADFFSMVAHDITNPLMAIRGYSEMLATRASDAEGRRLADKVMGCLDALSFLISDLVDFSAIEVGMLRTELKRMDPLPVLREVQGRMEIAARKKGIAFSLAHPPALPPVNGDARRLGQALQNLCANAIHYTPAGGAVALSAALSGGRLTLAVSDNGIGIAAGDIDKIFTRFYQAENARQHRGAGLGLGLKIAQQLIAAHGGRIRAESVLGKGSTFCFDLAAVVEPA